ncbi:MAG: amidohydrolase family protein [Acidobacteria bacterium]|nr:amidohydrolase family protein [Acidobacteriota bacterium]
MRNWGCAGALALGIIFNGVGPAVPALYAQDIAPEVLAYADLVLYNGKVITVDEKFAIAPAIALRDRRVLAVGESARILKMAGPKTRKIDLAGRSIVPGFVNPHSFFVAGGVGRTRPLKAHEPDAYLRELKEKIDATKPGEWVWVEADRVPALVYGLNAKLLDSIAPNNPVRVNFDTSWSVVNSRVLNLIGLDVPGVIKDKNGQPTGHVRGWASGVLSYDVMPWPKDLEPLIRKTKQNLEKYRSLGVTTMGGRNAGVNVTILHELWARKELATRVAITHEFPMYNPNVEAYFKRLGNIMGIGDDWFKITGITVGPVDGIPRFGGLFSIKPKIATIPTGSFGLFGEAKWAWSQDGMGYDPSGDMSWKETSDFKNVILANRYGWNITDMHTQGDGGMETVLDAVRKANGEKSILGKRWGNSHTPMRTQEQVQEMGRLGMTASVGPSYLFAIKDNYTLYVKQYGADAVNNMSPMKSMIQAGVKVSIEPNRDADDPTFTSYLQCIEDFITRKNEYDGKLWGKHEAISREDALRAATVWAAYFYFLENSRGTLEPGKLADLVVLGGDYLTAPEDKIGELPIEMVILDGKVAYDRASQPAPAPPSANRSGDAPEQ